MKELVIVGADIEIIELVIQLGIYSIVGIVDKNLSGNYYDYKILGNDDLFLQQKNNYLSSKIVVTLDDVTLKEKLYNKYKINGFPFAEIVSNKATVSSYAKIEEGAIIQNGVNIGPGVSIGRLSKINVNANIMHDGIIGNFNTIAPNAVTLGYIKTGNNVFVGANATILPNCQVNDNVVIGAGSVVTKNLESGWIYAGCPAKKLKPVS